MIPADLWHTALADWRIAVVSAIETRIEGCSDHTVGPAVLNK